MTVHTWTQVSFAHGLPVPNTSNLREKAPYSGLVWSTDSHFEPFCTIQGCYLCNCALGKWGVNSNNHCMKYVSTSASLAVAETNKVVLCSRNCF